MTNKDILRIAKEQSAIDANCNAEDFDSDRNMVVISKPNENARKYLKLPYFCNLISYGKNIVASVDGRIVDLITDYINGDKIEYCFETPRIHKLTREFEKYGKLPGYMSEYWLPDVDKLTALPCGFEVKILEPDGFADLYLPQWSSALSEKRPHLDMLAAAAYDSGKLVGLAGCSADCDTMWQIGIDVLPEYRRNGIAAALTSRLAVEILNRGKVPFYCCAWANIASARNAVNSGFRPAWAELGALDAGTTA
ncbi:MAG: GNAT family N-acetyltransferase [Oscillospiraceae bacterium]|jgi:GNAT superfamily N-acetyltransferase|nr:GNAT family N-acetyltransferase [Oscillospiraceae bacterium]